MSDELTTKQIIEGIERNLTTWEEGEGYRSSYDFDAERALVNDLRTLLEITKTALEPNTTIDLIHNPDGTIQRLTVTASSVVIETYGDVRVEPIDTPPPSKHDVVSVTAPSTLAMRASGDISVITEQPYTMEIIPPARGAVREYR